jgi:hypothetical protein
MRIVLGYLDIFLMLCAVVVWAYGAYHQFIFGQAWRRQAGRPDSWLISQPTIPEPYRTYRRRSWQAAFVFLALVALSAVVILTTRHLFPS